MEVASIVNKMLNRSADIEYAKEHVDELNTFTDVTPLHWGYYHIVEATNEHDYTEGKLYENWRDHSFELR